MFQLFLWRNLHQTITYLSTECAIFLIFQRTKSEEYFRLHVQPSYIGMIGLVEKDRQAVYIYIKKKWSLSLTILRFITQIFIEADRLQHVSTVCLRTGQAMMRHVNKFYCSDIRDTESEKKWWLKLMVMM